jgi:DNA-binding response OmpR family regulator
VLYDYSEMYFEAKLKVIVLGTDTVLKRVTTCLQHSSVDLVGLPLLTDVLSRLQQDNFDVILIDGIHAEACSACRRLAANSGVPIALLVRETEANWQNLCSWEVDSFISDEAGQIEMVARLAALARRKNKILVA